MIGWLAAAALLHRYTQSTETALEQDLRACRAQDPLGTLLKNLRSEAGGLSSHPEDFAGAIMDRGGLFAAYVACMQRGIKDLFSGARVVMQSQIDRHHILPRAQFPEAKRATSDCIANIAFITSSVNRSIGSSGPEVYLNRISQSVLESQCIPIDKDLWAVDRAEDFWNARKELLSAAFNEFLEDRLPNRRLN